MASELETLRNAAFRHVRRIIGDHLSYRDKTARTDIYHMNASQAGTVMTMTETEMAERWAPE